MNDQELQAFVLDLHKRKFSLDEIALKVTQSTGMVLNIADITSVLNSAIIEENLAIRAREEHILKTLCEIKKRLTQRDCSPLHKESEALYQTIWQAIGEHYGWKEEGQEAKEQRSQRQSTR